MAILTLCITNDCNLRCSYCFEENKTKEYMSLETAVTAIERFKPTNISFFGGEPLMNWELIKQVVEKYPDIQYGITTNGTLLTDDMADFMTEHNIAVLFSMDGIPYVHNKNRCNSFERSKAGLLRLLQRAKRLVEVRMTVLPEDMLYLWDGIKFIHELGVQNIIPVPVTDVPWSKEDKEEVYRQLFATYEWVIEQYNNNDNKKNLSVRFVDENLMHELEGERMGEPCGFGSGHFYAVGPDGNVWPCHQRPTKTQHPELCLGHVSGELRDIPRFDWKTDKCKTCTSVTCHGWCPSEIIDLGYVPEISCFWYHANEIMAMRFQEELLKATNIRSHVLNQLRWNIGIREKLNEIEQFSPEVISARLVDIYADIKGNSDLLLPNFRVLFYNKVEGLRKRCQTLMKK